ncbi:MAG: hypothetical protein A3D92_08555 [Bacteroidetes bacterium RIFCSPHIGHO2_02_FULL_44_7]|nr:MAG: hypothetical protein A3D92_08555 [Bacteroidetes bacterium RIFCSPHIGHO2_02_FULL_44_7]
MEFTFQHSKTYRAEIRNPISDSTTVLYALHGYGQLAKYFMRKLYDLPEDILLVVPEGMHRFYLNGTGGRVGASWMTKEAREIDIADNLAWLDALDARITKKYGIQKRYVLGFSQGGATALRWAFHGQISMDALCIWASDFPPDLFDATPKELRPICHYLIGDKDPYFRADRQDELCSLFRSKGFEIHQFDGEHDIDTKILKPLISQFHSH